MASPKEVAESEVAAAAPADVADLEEGQVSDGGANENDDSPDQSPADSADKDPESSASPKSDGPTETQSDAPPLPSGPPPGAKPSDDGWSAEWDAARSAWYFYNRFTGLSQWDNPRMPEASGADPVGAEPPTTSELASVAGGYNPAIHGSWDPNAPYAQAYTQPEEEGGDGDEQLPDATLLQVPGAHFNKRTGKFQLADQNAERHNDEAKSYRQMNNYFDVDKAANSHDGRSLKAERQGKKPTKKELSMWKEKRKARKEEKRRAWLRD